LAAGDLTTLSYVKTLMEISNDTSRDSQISQNITAASAKITNWCNRQFYAPGGTQTYTFECGPGSRGDDYIVDLAPYDLQSASSVVLWPDDSSPVTLNASNNDYVLEPVTKPEGVYKRLRITYLRWLMNSFAFNFGYAQIQVTGTWGFPTIPVDVGEACARTVATWMNSAVASFGSGGVAEHGGLPLPPSGGYGIPPDQLEAIRQYRRSVF